MARFKKIYIEITNVCNMHCAFCPPVRRAKAFMSPSDFDRVAREVAPYTEHVYLHVKGEPLLHPDLGEILAIAGRHGLRVNITTNGTLLPQRGEELLAAESLRQVNLSLHSQPGGNKTYLESCVAFARRAAQRGVFAVFRLWNGADGRETAQSLDRAFGARGDLDQRILKERSVTLAERIFLSLDQTWEWPSLSHGIVAQEGICQGLRAMAGVLVDGTVVPCCLDGAGEAPLGNLLREPFSAIMQRTLEPCAERMRNRMLPLELCRRCTYRTRFR